MTNATIGATTATNPRLAQATSETALRRPQAPQLRIAQPAASTLRETGVSVALSPDAQAELKAAAREDDRSFGVLAPDLAADGEFDLDALFGWDLATALRAFADRLPALIDRLRAATPEEAQAILQEETAALRALLVDGDDFKLDLVAIAEAVAAENGIGATPASVRTATISYDAEQGHFSVAIEAFESRPVTKDDGDPHQTESRVRADRFVFAVGDDGAPAGDANPGALADAQGDASGLFADTLADLLGDAGAFASGALTREDVARLADDLRNLGLFEDDAPVDAFDARIAAVAAEQDAKTDARSVNAQFLAGEGVYAPANAGGPAGVHDGGGRIAHDAAVQQIENRVLDAQGGLGARGRSLRTESDRIENAGFASGGPLGGETSRARIDVVIKRAPEFSLEEAANVVANAQAPVKAFNRMARDADVQAGNAAARQIERQHAVDLAEGLLRFRPTRFDLSA